MEREQMNTVIVGHVDHGKSTVIGRLLAETSSLPEGKLEHIQEYCRKNSKEFEYAFLLDALKDEQAQGITIDIARCYFKTPKRDYLILDAPGHIEFLKNMISGAARAEAAVLVIDAKEGIRENSKRHGYMLSLLGIQQVVVAVNKMDLVDYDQKVFDNIKTEYTEFLKQIGIVPKTIIPVSALKGDNIAENTEKLSWWNGENILTALDSFETSKLPEDKPFRMPVQDIYRFTSKGDNRRLVAGRVESGTLKVGDKVVFLPSNKTSTVETIQEFNHPNKEKISAGYSTGITLTEQIYLNRGDMMCKADERLPAVSSLIKANIFWMGKKPMVTDKEYKLKIGTAETKIKIKELINVMDASDLKKSNKPAIERHDVAECILECQTPLAFDIQSKIAATGRFVIVDDYDIRGGGIIQEEISDSHSTTREQVLLREAKWDKGLVSLADRSTRYGQMPKLMLITGKTGIDKKTLAKTVDKKLFDLGRKSYFLGIGNLLRGLDSDVSKEERAEHVRRLAEVAHIMMHAGLIVVATASDLNENELKTVRTIVGENSTTICNIGEEELNFADLNLSPDEHPDSASIKILDMMKFKNIMFGI